MQHVLEIGIKFSFSIGLSPRQTARKRRFPPFTRLELHRRAFRD